MAVEMMRLELSAARLRREASRRMIALALVLGARNRTQAPQRCGMDRRKLRGWGHRYNAQGLDGLFDRALSGRPPMLDAARMRVLSETVEAGPDPETDGVVRWRRRDLRVVVERRFGVRLAERTTGRVLRRLGFTRLSAQTRSGPKGIVPRGGVGAGRALRLRRSARPAAPLAAIAGLRRRFGAQDLEPNRSRR
jgi:transposase